MRWLALGLCTVCVPAWVAYGQSHSSLAQAAEKGDLNAVKAVAPGSEELNSRDARGYTPLMAAAAGGHAEVIRALIELGAQVNAVDNSGSSALHIATAYGHAEAMKALISSGADVTLRNNLGVSVLEIAQNSQRAPTIAILGPTSQDAGQVEYGEDPNDKYMSAARLAASDVTSVQNRLSSHKDVEDGVNALIKTGQEEARIWVQRTTSQKTRLLRAFQQQIMAELRMVQTVAKGENAQKTMADANALEGVWEKRMEAVSTRLREARRQEMAATSGRSVAAGRVGVGAGPGPAGRAGAGAGPVAVRAARPLPGLGTVQSTAGSQSQAGVEPVASGQALAVVPGGDGGGYFSQRRLAADQERLAEAWVASTDSVDQLAAEVNELSLRDLGYLRTTALSEKASDKTMTAIDAVVVLRAQRHAWVVATLQDMASAGATGPSTVGPEQGYAPGQAGRRGAGPGAQAPGQAGVPYQGGRRNW